MRHVLGTAKFQAISPMTVKSRSWAARTRVSSGRWRTAPPSARWWTFSRKAGAELLLALGFVARLQRLPEQQPDQLRVFPVPVEDLPDRLGHRVGIDGDGDADFLQLRPQDGGEELLLAPVVQVDGLLVGLGGGRDPIDPRPREPVLGELGGGGFEDAPPGVLRVVGHERN